MKEPVLILSDLHLGHSASRIKSAEQLRPLLEGAGTVVFNGDTFQELSKDFRPRSEVLLEGLRKLCSELGAEPVFLPGNHDPGWEGQGWLELAEGKVIITHGDAVMWGGSPWSREAFAGGEKIGELWAANPRAEFDPGERLGMAKDMAMLLRPPEMKEERVVAEKAPLLLRPLLDLEMEMEAAQPLLQLPVRLNRRTRILPKPSPRESAKSLVSKKPSLSKSSRADASLRMITSRLL